MDFQQIIIYTSIDISCSRHNKTYKRQQTQPFSVSRILTYFVPSCVFPRNNIKCRQDIFTEDRQHLENNTLYVSLNNTSTDAYLQTQLIIHACSKKPNSFWYKITHLNLR